MLSCGCLYWRNGVSSDSRVIYFKPVVIDMVGHTRPVIFLEVHAAAGNSRCHFGSDDDHLVLCKTIAPPVLNPAMRIICKN